MSYDFKIGTSSGSMLTLTSLNILAPKWEYFPYSTEKPDSDGLVYGGGWKKATWWWGFLTAEMIETLRTYCPGKSAKVYIRTYLTTTLTDDFQVTVIWPEKENWSANRVVDFELTFQNMVET